MLILIQANNLNFTTSSLCLPGASSTSPAPSTPSSIQSRLTLQKHVIQEFFVIENVRHGGGDRGKSRYFIRPLALSFKIRKNFGFFKGKKNIGLKLNCRPRGTWREDEVGILRGPVFFFDLSPCINGLMFASIFTLAEIFWWIAENSSNSALKKILMIIFASSVGRWRSYA